MLLPQAPAQEIFCSPLAGLSFARLHEADSVLCLHWFPMSCHHPLLGFNWIRYFWTPEHLPFFRIDAMLLFARVPSVTSRYVRGWCQGKYSRSAAFSPTHGVSPTGYRGMSSPETRVSTLPRGLAYACSWTPGAQHGASALLQVFLQTWLQARRERDPLGNGATFT